MRLNILRLSTNGNAMKIAKAAPKPQGNGSTICKPILIAKDANKNIKYILKLINTIFFFSKNLIKFCQL